MIYLSIIIIIDKLVKTGTINRCFVAIARGHAQFHSKEHPRKRAFLPPFNTPPNFLRLSGDPAQPGPSSFSTLDRASSRISTIWSISRSEMVRGGPRVNMSPYLPRSHPLEERTGRPNSLV